MMAQGAPARERFQRVHPAEQHPPVLSVFLGVEEVLKALLADHHQPVLLCQADQGGEVDKELGTIHHLGVNQ